MNGVDDPFESDESISSSLLKEFDQNGVAVNETQSIPTLKSSDTCGDLDSSSSSISLPCGQQQVEQQENSQPSTSRDNDVQSVHNQHCVPVVKLSPPFDTLHVPSTIIQQNINSNSYEKVIEMVCKGMLYIVTGPVEFEKQIRNK